MDPIERIRYLQANPQLAFDTFCGGGRSNCHGTTAYVLGIERLIIDLMPYALATNPGIPGMYILLRDKGPGYFGDISFSRVLGSDLIERSEPDNSHLVCFFEPGQSRNLEHSGVYIAQNDLMFHQWDIGRSFGITTVEEYLEKEFREWKIEIKVEYYKISSLKQGLCLPLGL